MDRSAVVATPGLTEQIVSEVRALSSARLPDAVLQAARNCVLDWFAVTVAGADEPLVHSLTATAREQGGRASASIVWHGELTSEAFAALINGSAADALDFADSNPAMRGHSTRSEEHTSELQSQR